MTYETWEDALLLIPEHMRYGTQQYIQYGIPPGGFLTAVMENNFFEACCHADWVNKASLPAWGEFLMLAPKGCWGGPETVSAWIQRGGLEGKLPKQEVNDGECV